MENTKLKMGLVAVIGILSGAAWLFGSGLASFYLDVALDSDGSPILSSGLTILLCSVLFGAAGTLLTMWAGRRLPEAPYIHLLANMVFVLFTAAFIDGPVALVLVLFEQKLWAFIFGGALVFLVAHRKRIFQPAIAATLEP